MNPKQLQELESLRHQLHQNPELSGKEHHTPEIITRYLADYPPDKVFRNLGGTGIAAIYESGNPGPCIAFRCELDALPIAETDNLAHHSNHKGISHKCGHDGHMAIVTGLGQLLAKERPAKGKVVLLYQPAEETGEGAENILNDPQFKKINPDYIFGLHNLPGFEKGIAVIKKGTFSAASKGMIIKLHGATAHAAAPEHGKSPAIAMSEIIKALTRLSATKEDDNDFTLVTVVHALLGEIAFGTTPGYAEVRATLRAYRGEAIEIMTKKAVAIVKEFAEQYDLKEEISWTEEFSETRNNDQAVEIIINAATKTGIEIKEIDKPFRWSEDFGAYSKTIASGFFGLGAGIDAPELHQKEYDFPDEIIPYGIKVFYAIIQDMLNK